MIANLADALIVVDEQAERIKMLSAALDKANYKVDDLYNLFSYAEQDEDVLNMTGGKPLIGWLREREEEWYRKGNR